MVELEPTVSDVEARLPTPQTAEEFSFPMTPYCIQLKFMQRLFDTIEDSKFAIFESPTGTGKSLSIICGSLTWLEQHNAQRIKTKAMSEIDHLSKAKDDRPDWVKEFERKQHLLKVNEDGLQADVKERKYNAWVDRTRRREAADIRSRRLGAFGGNGIKSLAKALTASTKRKMQDADNGIDNGTDDEMIVDTYFSDSAVGGSGGPGRAALDNDVDDPVQYSDSVRKLLQKRDANKPYYDSDSDSDIQSDDAIETPEEPSVTKIFYASRTHSQLQQFVNEIKRTSFSTNSRIKCVTLGSRWQLCTNDAVRSSCHSVHTLNERCLEMQQNSKKKRCSMLPVQHTPMLDYKDLVGRAIMDIEELVTEGRRLSVCAYYGTRSSVNAAHVVALPYNMLLSKSARQSMGISLKDNVVIIDEAHNLVDTILSIHSVSLDSRTVSTLLEIVQMYFSKYWKRLKGSNTVYVRQTIALLKALSKYMVSLVKLSDGKETTSVFSVNEFLHQAHADHFNVFKIDRYLRESKLGRKLNMFADYCKQKAAKEMDIAEPNAKRGRDANNGSSSAQPPSNLAAVAPATAVSMFETFMESIGNPERRGARMIVRTFTAGSESSSEEHTGVELKYLLLDPSETFGVICKEARAVILAGGTMKPANDVVEQLFPRPSKLKPNDKQRLPKEAAVSAARLDPENAQLFAWDHVVDPSHVAAVVVSSGPTGQELRFTFQDQSDLHRLREAGNALAALCNVIPGGVVVFFPSYSLLGRMSSEWRASGIMQRIERKKPVFAESNLQKEAEVQVNILDQYTAQVREPGSNGAVLLSVVGGRLSEGINFSDDLGRAVVMIGVPFPSLNSPELAERLANYESSANMGIAEKADAKAGQMGPRARELYESLCMRAVNQSIGRAIRHQRDYAAIVFLDCRYADARIASKLPSWIVSSSASKNQSASSVAKLAFGPALSRVASFFKQDFNAS
ncbi:ATP-dependent DNA helicase chl1 [Coemansia asiatica]|uniref:ATP-dependent DNA helicase CHL1 n=1 Tax=Coemansia asiatica TaxID=1052880 RepID=A0A9W7XH59_9FUNG|nr:ATP-dependent DNA helicase chl1 [Coemansia asiatica]